MAESNIILYMTEDGKSNMSLLSRDGMVWMNQSQIAELFETSKQNIGQHIDNIIADNELSSISVVKNYFTTASDGKQYEVRFYSLQMILAIGFRVRSPRAVQFRQWANRNLTEYLQKGFVMDDERLKNPNGRPDYFDELLERIRDIRASEKRFYQKVRDLFALSADYDKTDRATQMFFAATQNKLLYAVTGITAAEIVMSRADAKQPNMGLTSWAGKVVRKGDVIIAKNYLTKEELTDLNQLVTIFLESAEFRARRRQTTTMSFWKDNVDVLIQSHGMKVLENAGRRFATQSDSFAYGVYAEFNQKRKIAEAEQADLDDLKMLLEAEKRLKETDRHAHQ